MNAPGPTTVSTVGGPGLPPPAPLLAVVRLFEWSGKIVCVVTLAVLFFGLLANVILRYSIGAGLDWAYDIHSILLPWMVAGGLILATVHNRNIAISMLPDRLSPNAARILMILVSVTTLVISVFVVWSAFPIIRAAHYQKIAALGGISQLWGYASLVYGFAGVAVLCLCDCIALLMGRYLRQTGAASSLS